MPSSVDDDILRFDIAMQITERVDGMDGFDHLGGVKSGHALVEDIVVSGEELEEVTASVKFHHEVEIFGVLKRVAQGGNPVRANAWKSIGRARL